MEDFFKNYLSELALAVIGAFVGWFFQRKKQQAEVRGSEIENAEKGLQYYRQMVDDLGSRLTQAIMELNTTKMVIKELEEKIEALTEELRKYKQLNGKL
ncbi:hypothetical protein [Pedobacter sp.]|uniref:hypothetical protein n=1 Tax=Pedobacter sp. TaxID=1411316 RepID=UPI0031E35605